MTGGIVVAIIAHALWDVGLFTGGLSDPTYPGVGLFLVMDVVLVVLLLVRRKHIELPPAERTWT